MTREQMIDVLEDYCNKNICVSCKLRPCGSNPNFSDMTDEELEYYVSYIEEKNTDKESQNVCESVEKRMEPVKVLKQVTRMNYPEKMENVLPLKEFVKNILDKGYKVEMLKCTVRVGVELIVYKEVEMEE